MTAREALVPVEWPHLDEEHEYVMAARVRVRNGSQHIDTGGSQMVVGLGCAFAAVPTTTWQRVDPDPELPTTVGAVVHCHIDLLDGVLVAELVEEEGWQVIGGDVFFEPREITRCLRVLWAGGDR